MRHPFRLLGSADGRREAEIRLIRKQPVSAQSRSNRKFRAKIIRRKIFLRELAGGLAPFLNFTRISSVALTRGASRGRNNRLNTAPAPGKVIYGIFNSFSFVRRRPIGIDILCGPIHRRGRSPERGSLPRQEKSPRPPPKFDPIQREIKENYYIAKEKKWL